MRHLFKIKREKSPKPPQQPILSGELADVGPPDCRTTLNDNSEGGRSLSNSQVLEGDSPDTAILQDGGSSGPQILFQDGMDANQQLPTSEGTQTSGVAIGGAGCGSLLAGK